MDKTDVGFDEAMFAQRFNPFSPEYAPHFRQIYQDMRAKFPIAHTDELGGVWVVTRYDDIACVMSDRMGGSRINFRSASNRGAQIDRSPSGLPVGVQIIGPYLGDRTTIMFAELLEREFGGLVPSK